MAKKYKGEESSGEYAGVNGLRTSIMEYVTQFAPDILTSLTIMRSAPVLEYYTRLFDREYRSEEKRMGKSMVIWPYADRIIYLARKFASLSDEEREFVVTARKEKIFWRGDTLSFFNTVITETCMFRDLEPAERSNYKKRIWNVAKSLSERHANAA